MCVIVVVHVLFFCAVVCGIAVVGLCAGLLEQEGAIAVVAGMDWKSGLLLLSQLCVTHYKRPLVSSLRVKMEPVTS